MRLTVTSLEDRTVPAGFGGLGHVLSNPTQLNTIITDLQSIISTQVPATQFPTLLSDAQALAAAAPAAAKTDANTLVTTIQSAEAGGQITRQGEFNIQSAAQTVFKDLRGTSTPRSETAPLKQDLRSVNTAFEPTGLGHGLGRLVNNANPTDLSKLLTDLQTIASTQVPATQFATLLSDAQALAAAAPAAAKTDANTLVTTIQSAEADGQITLTEAAGIRSAAQTVFKDLRGTSTPRSETAPIKQDLKALDKAFEPTAADRSLIRSDLKTIRQDSLHEHYYRG